MTDDIGCTEDDGAGLSLHAKFDLTLKAMGEREARMERLVRQLNAPPMQPVPRTFVATQTIIPASGFLVATFGGPDMGHHWYVREIILGGLTRVTAVAGSADIFVSAMDLRTAPNIGAIGFADIRDFATPLPSTAFYGRGELVGRAPEDLYVAFEAATPGQQYVAVAHIEDIQDAAVRQDIAL